MIGVPDGAPAADDAPVLAATLSQKNDRRRAALHERASRGCSTRPTTPCSSATCCSRSTTATRAIVSPGPATGLARLLALYGARPQIAAKVKHLVVAAGSFPAGRRRPAITSDVAAASKLFADWPTPHRRRRRRGRRGAAVSGREHREGFRLVARASRRRRLSRVQADAVRRAGPGARGDALRRRIRTRASSSCRSPARSPCTTTGGRDSRRAAGWQASVPDRRPGAEGTRRSSAYTDDGRRAAGAATGRGGRGGEPSCAAET